MPRTIVRLTTLKIARTNAPGMYADGAGLYLQVANSGAKSWIYRYMLYGKAREMGLGSISAISLLDARTRATECRKLRHEGIDPIEARRRIRGQQILDAAKAITFEAAADAYIASHRAGWRNAKHGAQWKSTLATYAEPVFSKLSVQAIDTALVLKVLEPIWATKSETAGRLRGRIEAVLDWATARGYRKGENPARWRGHLDKLLPARSKVRAVKHHAALAYDEIPDFMPTLRTQEGIAARALEFAILTAARTGEVIGARWCEIDLADKIWTIPVSRMKAGKEHRVPLSARVLAILEEVKPLDHIVDGQNQAEAFVFLGRKQRQPLSSMAFLMLLRRIGRDDLTAHGFRSTFRDWAAERTNFSSEVAEMALAHSVGNKVEAAYRRGDLFNRRRLIMDEWAKFCGTPNSAAQSIVVALREKV